MPSLSSLQTEVEQLLNESGKVVFSEANAFSMNVEIKYME